MSRGNRVVASAGAALKATKAGVGRAGRGAFAKGKKLVKRIFGCFVAGTVVTTPTAVVPIELLQIGDRVLTHVASPLETERPNADRASGYDSSSLIAATFDVEDETSARVRLLRPVEWFEARGIEHVGDRTELVLPEAAVNGMSKVVELTPFEVTPGPGHLVLMTVERTSDDVFEVSFVEGGVLRPTGLHPLYSIDRQAWVRVHDLRAGERLQTAEGAVTVQTLEKVRGAHRVYNLEVEGVHEYLVGEAGVRAHNFGCDGDSVSGFRAVSKAEADDIAATGILRPKPDGRSMEAKWFSETRESAEQFQTMSPELTDIVEVDVPKSLYDRSYRVPNIDGTGPGFCIACDDLHLLTPKGP